MLGNARAEKERNSSRREKDKVFEKLIQLSFKSYGCYILQVCCLIRRSTEYGDRKTPSAPGSTPPK